MTPKLQGVGRAISSIRCVTCRQPMRRCKRTVDLLPGEVRHEARGECHRCYSRQWARTHHDEIRGRRRPGRPLHHPDNTIDEVAIQRVLEGMPTTLTCAEFTHAFDELDRRGYTAPEMAQRLGCAERTITRHRARLRAQQAAA